MSCKKCKCKVCSCIKNDVPKIAVNGIVQNPDEKGIVDVKVPTKTSDLINDSGFGQGGNGSGKIDEIRVNGVPAPIQGKTAIISVPTKTSDLTNDSNFVTKPYVDFHIINKNNPHNVTKEQLNLGNVDNTSDLNKPISTATQIELNNKLNTTDVKSEIVYEDLKPVNSVAIEKHSIKKINTITDLRNTAGEYEGQVVELVNRGLNTSVKYTWYNTIKRDDNGGSIIRIGNGGWMVYFNEIVNIEDFGAVPGGDITDVLRKVLTSFTRTDNARGLLNIKFPKGIYYVSDTITLTSPLGLYFSGVNFSATVIKFTSPNKPMFKFQTFIGLSFSDMTIDDISTIDDSTDVSFKSNSFLEFNGVGGGRNLYVDRLRIIGFHTVFKDIGLVNSDTIYMNKVTASGHFYFYDSENSQSVCCSFRDMSIGGGHVNGACFFIAGMNNFVLDTINFVSPAPLFRFKDIASRYATSFIYCKNVKLEWQSAHFTFNETPKLIDGDGNYVSVNIVFEGGGLYSTTGYDKIVN